MSSLLAWPRVFAFLILILTLTPYAYSQEESIFTSSVTYCNPPETLLIQRFELAYFPSNRSVSFNVSAASVQANVNVSANVLLNVYGMKPVNITLDLCGLLGGALCPLPMYNFTGADSITLPSSLEVLEKIPGIAYKIPDLEGFAQLTLTEPKTENVRACVQATLSNGRSAHQPAVEWTTGGVTLAALSVALWQTVVSPESILPFRFLELMYLFQTISSSAFLSLNYPSVYRAYALNFGWAMGLLTSGPNSGFQNSINNMRHLTGGNLADAVEGSAVGFVNRRLSPYNDPPPPISSREIINAYRDLSSNFTVDLSSLSSSAPRSSALETIVNGVVQTVTSATSNVLQAGIPIYVNTKHIATANAFMTVFLVSLIMFVVAFGVFAIGYGVRFLLERKQVNSRVASVFMNFDYISFAFSWFLRLGLVAVFPLLIFIFCQWTLKDSWLSVFLSVLTLVAISALIMYPSFLIQRLARQESPSALYTPDTQSLSRNGPLFAQYRSPRYYFFAPLLIAFFLRAIFISFATSSAEAQIALLLVVELGLVCAHFVLKPAKTKGADVFNTYLAITRLVCTGLMIAFLEKLQVMAIPRVVIGIVVALAWSVAVLVVIGNIAWHTVLAFALLFGFRKRATPSILDSPVNSEGSMLEKGIRGTQSGSTRSNLNEKNLRVAAGAVGDGDSGVSLPYAVANSNDIEEIGRGRPGNPTPENNGAFDPYLLTSFPISPTTTVTTMEPPSLYSRDSGTITVGSLLPRRWSFHMSQPGSPAGSSFGHGYPSTQMSSSPVPPSSPSESSHGGALSRNTSVRAQQQQAYQQRHSDIEEEKEGLPTSPTVKPT